MCWSCHAGWLHSAGRVCQHIARPLAVLVPTCRRRRPSSGCTIRCDSLLGTESVLTSHCTTPFPFRLSTARPARAMSSAPGSSHLNYTVGALVAVGGAFGYAQRKSVPSLVAGIGIGYYHAERTPQPLYKRALPQSMAVANRAAPLLCRCAERCTATARTLSRTDKARTATCSQP